MESILVSLLIIVPLGGVIIFLVIRISRLQRVYNELISCAEKNAHEKILIFEREQATLLERLKQFTAENEILLNENGQTGIKIEQLLEEKIRLFSENNYLKEKMVFQKAEFERLQKQALLEFENIAGRILKNNTEDFSETNQKKITELILPLKEKIQNFERKVEETYEKGLKDQTDLKAELKKLQDMNTKISNEANNLTRALKGDVKQQGNWGEVVLERILERSGLTEGHEFERERVMQNSEGKTIRPDVIVNLPDKKHIIIDSKVSLVAYERFVNAEEADNKEKFKREHVLSVKSHVKELGEKHYSSSPQLNSPDFVLLFIPIESSFSIAIEYDQQLFTYAWNNKVVIVSPSTLLATLRTIASIWQQENQTRNALEIARQSGALYDKFVGFLEDLERIGRNISLLQQSYEEANKKLGTGKGNLIRKVEQLKELGASSTKQIPDSLIN